MSLVTLIGSGNVAWHLGQGLINAGHQIDRVYSRTLSNARELSQLWQNTTPTDQLDFSDCKAELYIIAIKDQALDELVASLIVPPQAIVVHTSGPMAMNVLKKFSRHGVFYPLQTFTKGKETDLKEVVFGIEAVDANIYQILATIASTLSNKVQPISSSQRKVLHLAAVFACNFTNHLFTISEDILMKENLTFGLLKPLVEETVRKAFEIGPAKGQTGPAARGDETVMGQQRRYLSEQPEWQELYQLISKQILERSNKNQ